MTLPTISSAGVQAALSPTIEDILGPDGLLSKQFDAYQHRTQQIEMANAVLDMLRGGGCAVFQAGTGTGKSFACLVPAAMYALATDKPVIIVTGTITLQDQMFDHDIPRLLKIFPHLKVRLALGRNKYISKRRFANAIESAKEGRLPGEIAHDLERVQVWEASSKTGRLDEMEPNAPEEVLEHIRSDRGDCRGKECPTHASCHFYAARRSLIDANIIICNMHLYIYDALIRGSQDLHADFSSAEDKPVDKKPISVLPLHDAVIFDEAHKLEDTAISIFSEELTSNTVPYRLKPLLREGGVLDRIKKHFAKDEPNNVEYVRETLIHLRERHDHFWHEAAQYAKLELGWSEDSKVRLPNQVEFDIGAGEDICKALEDTFTALEGTALWFASLKKNNESKELLAEHLALAAMLKKSAVYFEGLHERYHTMTQERAENYCYFLDVKSLQRDAPSDRYRSNIELHKKPISVAARLKALLFDPMRAVVTTSATLSVKRGKNFEYFQQRVGIPMTHALNLESPFDYRKNATLWLNSDDGYKPNHPNYPEVVGQWLEDFVKSVTGGTLVLCTSNDSMRRMHRIALPLITKLGRRVFMQGDTIENMAKDKIIAAFKQAGDGIIFGVQSFWEGVDIPGPALSNVVIPNIPNDVPSVHIEAQKQFVKSLGLHEYQHFLGPRVAIKMCQGTGRLIRTDTDKGNIVVLDPRLKYGHSLVLDALPPFARGKFSMLENLGWDKMPDPKR